jgi:hypothetical protein
MGECAKGAKSQTFGHPEEPSRRRLGLPYVVLLPYMYYFSNRSAPKHIIFSKLTSKKDVFSGRVYKMRYFVQTCDR